MLFPRYKGSYVVAVLAIEIQRLLEARMGIGYNPRIVEIVQRVCMGQQTMKQNDVASLSFEGSEFLALLDNVESAGIVVWRIETFWVIVEILAHTCSALATHAQAAAFALLRPSSHRIVPPPLFGISVKQ
jgi:hypothetical protein